MPMIDLFHDSACSRLYPFHLVEGVGGIRHGAFTQQERWDRVDAELAAKGWSGEIAVNSRWIPDAGTADDILNGTLPFGRDGVVLARSANEAGHTQLGAAPRSPRMLEHANDLFAELAEQLELDLQWLRTSWELEPFAASGSTQVYGPADNIWVSGTAKVRAASLDAANGAIVVGPNATLEPGSHIEGPVVIQEGAVVRTGAHIRGATVIGPHCKVGGEVSNVSFQGWANKAHGGFLGNSVIGRWCNLGAGTTSSNLKNTYGSIRQWSMQDNGMVDSGLQFCGVLMGDHSKCGIGTMLNTGSIIGPACVVFDAGFPPKHLPPFSWHNAREGSTDLHDLPRMLATADVVMARRGLSMTQKAKDNLSALHLQVQGDTPSN